MVDALDFLLVNSLQINPRVPWTALAPILNADASTLTRRWNRLVDQGLVWGSCYSLTVRHPRGIAMAFVEVGCQPGRREDVINTLIELAPVASVHCTSGTRDLYLSVVALSPIALDSFIDSAVCGVSGVIATRTHYVRGGYQDGSSWRLSRLSRAQTAQVEQTLPTRVRPAQPTPFALEVIDAIGDDIRRPLTKIRTKTGHSMANVSQTVDTLLSVDWASWRVDFATGLAGDGVSAMLWLNVPQPELERVATALRLFPQVRMCVSTTGEANLTVSMWLWNLGELDDIEDRLTRVFTDVRVLDRWLIPRIAKRMGHVIGRDGRHIDYVPLTPAEFPRSVPM